jgi:adenylate cyclase
MLIINICNKRQNLRVEHGHGPLELGRGAQRSVQRVMLEDVYVSRDQILIDEQPDGRLQVVNLSLKREIALVDGTILAPGGSTVVTLPTSLGVGETQIGIEREASDDFNKDTLQTIADPPRRYAGADAPTSSKLFDLGESPSPEKLASWMERLLSLQQSGADQDDFLKQTARAIVEMIGLEVGMVILRSHEDWNVAAGHASDDRGMMRFSRTLVNHVCSERRTFFQDLDTLAEPALSLQAVNAVVASPIFGIHDEVAGILYGARHRAVLGHVGIRPLEAQIVQLLAGAVSANLARAAAVRTRIQFEQFFSSELVRELERNPDLLEGRNQEVTILVSDLRNFTALSERLGPSHTCKIIRDLMEHLTERIVDQGGVIVDYAGDGILAMWNAPVSQPDHAARACRAAQAMQAAMAGINARWQPIVGDPLHLGIGINTGLAQVGNTGCSRKFKYGPHGHTVNLAARIQGATKKLGLPILVAVSVRDKIQETFLTSEAGHVTLAGVKEELILYEVKNELGNVTRTPD